MHLLSESDWLDVLCFSCRNPSCLKWICMRKKVGSVHLSVSGCNLLSEYLQSFAGNVLSRGNTHDSLCQFKIMNWRKIWGQQLGNEKNKNKNSFSSFWKDDKALTLLFDFIFCLNRRKSWLSCSRYALAVVFTTLLIALMFVCPRWSPEKGAHAFVPGLAGASGLATEQSVLCLVSAQPCHCEPAATETLILYCTQLCYLLNSELVWLLFLFRTIDNSNLLGNPTSCLPGVWRVRFLFQTACKHEAFSFPAEWECWNFLLQIHGFF